MNDLTDMVHVSCQRRCIIWEIEFKLGDMMWASQVGIIKHFVEREKTITLQIGEYELSGCFFIVKKLLKLCADQLEMRLSSSAYHVIS